MSDEEGAIWVEKERERRRGCARHAGGRMTLRDNGLSHHLSSQHSTILLWAFLPSPDDYYIDIVIVTASSFHFRPRLALRLIVFFFLPLPYCLYIIIFIITFILSRVLVLYSVSSLSFSLFIKLPFHYHHLAVSKSLHITSAPFTFAMQNINFHKCILIFISFHLSHHHHHLPLAHHSRSPSACLCVMSDVFPPLTNSLYIHKQTYTLFCIQLLPAEGPKIWINYLRIN